jgi:hypothetical protein
MTRDFVPRTTRFTRFARSVLASSGFAEWEVGPADLLKTWRRRRHATLALSVRQDVVSMAGRNRLLAGLI